MGGINKWRVNLCQGIYVIAKSVGKQILITATSLDAKNQGEIFDR